MTEQRYRPEEHDAARVLSAFAALGSEIAALQQDAQIQRERADDYMREASAALKETLRLRVYVEELERTIRAFADGAQHLEAAAERTAARWAAIQQGGVA